MELSVRYVRRLVVGFAFIIILIPDVIHKWSSPWVKIEINVTRRFNDSADAFYPCIAVLVEFRTTDLITTVVHNVNYHIPSTWPIQIFHGRTNQDFIKRSTLAPFIATGKIILTLMNISYVTEQTNEILTDPKFWQQVRGEKILFFQIDSIMCSNSPHKITDYLDYDYIGAPWDSFWHQYNKALLVGNGGFSLRTRSKILALLALMPYDRKIHEDAWYAMNIPRVNGTVASVNVSRTFSVEAVYYERPLAARGTIRFCSVFRKLIETCPEAKIVQSGKC